MALMKADRILVLEKEDPSNKDSGMIDNKVFEGKNNLHCFMTDNGMWTFRYEHGIVPPALREMFTSFKFAKAHAEQYFATKKIKIADVKN